MRDVNWLLCVKGCKIVLIELVASCEYTSKRKKQFGSHGTHVGSATEEQIKESDQASAVSKQRLEQQHSPHTR